MDRILIIRRLGKNYNNDDDHDDDDGDETRMA